MEEPPAQGEQRAVPTEGAPRWVKVFAIVVLVLIVLFVLANVTGLVGDRGPGRHLSSALGTFVPPL